MAIILDGTTGVNTPGVVDTGNLSVAGSTTLSTVLPISGGGTNSTATATAGGVGYGTGTAHAYTAVGTNGQVLTSAGAGAPTWATITSTPTIVRSARTSNTILGTADASTLIAITSGTFTQTFTAAATLGSGWFCYIQNAGTGDITLDPNGAELIDGLATYIMYPNEVRLVQCTGTDFNSVVLSPFYRAFTTSGTFTKPPGYFYFNVSLWGGGGGAGRSNQSCGGGAGGSCMQGLVLASTVGTTQAVTVGAGGTGKTGSSGDGTAGGSSTFLSNTATGGAQSIFSSGLDGAGSAGGSISPYSTSTVVAGFAYQGGLAGTTASAVIAGYSEYGGGGGGGSCAGAGPFSNYGGGSFYGGGGGGGGQRANATNPNGTGGVSKWGGSGGAGGTDSVAGTAGSAPGGGGGGAGINQNGGDGGRGEVRIIGVA